MDEQLTQKINEAAKEFSDCLGDSYQALTKRTASTQEQVAQLTQAFFEGVIEHLRARLKATRRWFRNWTTSNSSNVRPHKRSRRRRPSRST